MGGVGIGDGVDSVDSIATVTDVCDTGTSADIVVAIVGVVAGSAAVAAGVDMTGTGSCGCAIVIHVCIEVCVLLLFTLFHQ